MSRENLSSGLPTRCDTNVQSKKTAGGSKFQIKEDEGLYYLFSEYRGADQLSGYCAADLRLSFRLQKKQVFSPGILVLCRVGKAWLTSCCIALTFLWTLLQLSLIVRKPVFGVSDQVPHKPGCTATEGG